MKIFKASMVSGLGGPESELILGLAESPERPKQAKVRAVKDTLEGA